MAKRTPQPKKMADKKKGKPGRKPYVPTEEHIRQAEALAGYGLTTEHVASILKISTSTVERHLAEAMAEGRAKAAGNITRTLYQQAMSGNTAALIFWTKTRLRWQEVQRVESDVSAKIEGSALPVTVVIEGSSPKKT